MEQLSGGDMIVRALEDEGVEYIFGYPGGAALHIYDSILKPTQYLTFWFATSRQRRMRPTGTRARPESRVWF